MNSQAPCALQSASTARYWPWIEWMNLALLCLLLFFWSKRLHYSHCSRHRLKVVFTVHWLNTKVAVRRNKRVTRRFELGNFSRQCICHLAIRRNHFLCAGIVSGRHLALFSGIT